MVKVIIWITCPVDGEEYKISKCYKCPKKRYIDLRAGWVVCRGKKK